MEGLGGEAYEVVPLGGERLAVAIADVCGKGRGVRYVGTGQARAKVVINVS